jgi:hypothetical protein
MSEAERTQDSQTEADPEKFFIFRYDEAPLSENTDFGGGKAEGEDVQRYGAFLKAGYNVGNIGRLVYRQTGDNPFSVLHLHVKAGRILPRHSLGEDCIYIVSAGSIIMGSRVLYAGDGFFVPANSQYGYRAGDTDAEVIEVRHGPRQFSIRVPKQPDSLWADMETSLEENRGRWEQNDLPPSRRAALAERPPADGKAR